jgi:sugar lactone lactonase YvrE
MNIRPWFPRTIVIGALTALAVAGIGAAGAQAQQHIAGAPAGTVSLPVGPRPESITKGWDGKFFVSIQGAPDLGRNDGEIRTFDPASGATTTFVTGLDNPRGITFTGRYLVVTDTTVLWIIDRSGAKRILAAPADFPHPVAFFNDVVSEPGTQSVLVTEMGGRAFMRDPATGRLWPTDSPQALLIPVSSRIYRVSLTGKVSDFLAPTRKALVMNGVALGPSRGIQRGHVLAVDMFYGNLVDIDPISRKTTIVVTGLRAADGLAQARNGFYYVTSFDNGRLYKVSRDGENIQVLLDNVGFQSTADLYLDENAKRVLVADTLHNAIIIVPLS